MPTSQSVSAEILQFPVGGRPGQAKSGRVIEGIWKPQVPAPEIMPESGWYHDVAIHTDTPHKS